MSTKEKIFETALELFSKNGFNGTSIRMITRETGITVASFYNHFKSKDELLQEIYNYYRKLYIESDDIIPDYEGLLDKLGPIGLFKYLTQSFVESMKNDKMAKLSRIIVMEQYTNKTACEIVFKDQQKLLSSIEEIFELMVRKGLIKVKNARMTGRLIGYVYLGFSSDSINRNVIGKEGIDKIVERQIDLIVQFFKEIM
jgi:AcrR family transcriptional regulator